MISKRLDDLADELSLIDADDVFHYLIDRGEKFSQVPDWANDTNRVPGCISRLWAEIGIVGDAVSVRTRSDSVLVDGTARVVADVLDGVPLDIARAEVNELDRIPPLLGLSSQRRNGLANLIGHLKKGVLS